MSSDDSSNNGPASTQEPAAPTTPATEQTPTPSAAAALSGQTLTAEQRNQRREELLKRQREAREKAQQLAQSARANATGSTPVTTAASSANPTSTAATTSTTPVATTAPAPAPAPPVTDAPVRENMVQQAVAFLSSPNVRSADEAKKRQFLEKKGLTAKEIELAQSRVTAGSGSPAPTATTTTTPVQPAAQVTQTTYPSAATAGAGAGPVPPPVPPRTYASQPYSPQQQIAYLPQQQVAPADPLAFRRKLIVALLISGGITALTGVLVKKLLYPMVRGVTHARQTLAAAQTELLAKLREKLAGYKDYLQSLRLGDSRSRRRIQRTDVDESKKTTVEEVNEDGTPVDTKSTTTTTPTKSTAAVSLPSTMEQLDKFSQTLDSHAKSMTFEELKAVRSLTQDLAEYITKETYSLTSSLAYPTSRYYGYNTAGAAASGKGGLNDPTTPEAALKSEIRSLKGLLLNWRNFPTAKEATALSPANGVSSLVQQ